MLAAIALPMAVPKASVAILAHSILPPWLPRMVAPSLTAPFTIPAVKSVMKPSDVAPTLEVALLMPCVLAIDLVWFRYPCLAQQLQAFQHTAVFLITLRSDKHATWRTLFQKKLNRSWPICPGQIQLPPLTLHGLLPRDEHLGRGVAADEVSRHASYIDLLHFRLANVQCPVHGSVVRRIRFREGALHIRLVPANENAGARHDAPDLAAQGHMFEHRAPGVHGMRRLEAVDQHILNNSCSQRTRYQHLAINELDVADGRAQGRVTGNGDGAVREPALAKLHVRKRLAGVLIVKSLEGLVFKYFGHGKTLKSLGRVYLIKMRSSPYFA